MVSVRFCLLNRGDRRVPLFWNFGRFALGPLFCFSSLLSFRGLLENFTEFLGFEVLLSSCVGVGVRRWGWRFGNLKRGLVHPSFQLPLLFCLFGFEFESFEFVEIEFLVEFSGAGKAKISEGPSLAPPLRSST